MKSPKQSMILAIASLLIASQATAFPSAGDKLVREKLQSARAKSQRTCVDFSGAWTGACVTGTESTPATVTMVQHECSFISADSSFFAIGGSREENHAIPQQGGDLFTQNVTHTNWNDENGTALVFASDVAVSQTGKGYIYADHIDSALYMDGEKLVSYSKGEYGTTVCQLQKAK